MGRLPLTGTLKRDTRPIPPASRKAAGIEIRALALRSWLGSWSPPVAQTLQPTMTAPKRMPGTDPIPRIGVRLLHPSPDQTIAEADTAMGPAVPKILQPSSPNSAS